MKDERGPMCLYASLPGPSQSPTHLHPDNVPFLVCTKNHISKLLISHLGEDGNTQAWMRKGRMAALCGQEHLCKYLSDCPLKILRMLNSKKSLSIHTRALTVVGGFKPGRLATASAWPGALPSSAKSQC